MRQLIRKELTLTFNDTLIPSRGSSNIPIELVNDTSYQEYTIVPYVGWIDRCGRVISTVVKYENDIITLPGQAFQKDGVIAISIALIDNHDVTHIEKTLPATIKVIDAPSTNDVLPEEELWTSAVNDLVIELNRQIQKDVNDMLARINLIADKTEGLQEEVRELQAEAETQQTVAERQQIEATRLQSIASEQQTIAETMQSEALEQQEITSGLQTKTQEQQTEATRLQNVAQEQQVLANTLQVTAKEQQDIASEQQTKAEIQQAEATKLQGTAKEQQEIVNSLQTKAQEQQTKVSELQTTALAQQTEATRLQGVASDQQQAVNSLKSEAQEQQTKAQQQQAKAQELQTEAETQQTIAETQQSEATRLQKATDDAIDEMKRRISELVSFTISIVDALPAIGTPNVIYLVHKKGTTDDVYDEYLWIDANQSYETLGSTEVDVSNCLALTGGTMSGNLVLNNNVIVTGKDTNGVTSRLIGRGTDNTTFVGGSSYPITLTGSTLRPAYNSSTLALYSDTTNKLPLTGGILTGSIRFTNREGVNWTDTDGKVVPLLLLNNTNNFVVGDDRYNLFLSGKNERPFYNLPSVKIALLTDVEKKLSLDGGLMTGNLLFNNNVGITSYHTNGSALNLIYVNGNNVTRVGAVANPLQLNSSSRPIINATTMQPSDNNQVAVIGDITPLLSKSGGTMSGNLTFNNNKGVSGYSAGNTLHNLIYVNSSNQIIMGSTGAPITINSSATPLINTPRGTETIATLNDIKRTAVTTGQITLTNGSGSLTLDYPDGFNSTNSYIDALGCAYSVNNVFEYGSLNGGATIGCRMTTNGLVVYINAESGPSGSKAVRIHLVKG